jgi:hypothetical protein
MFPETAEEEGRAITQAHVVTLVSVKITTVFARL